MAVANREKADLSGDRCRWIFGSVIRLCGVEQVERERLRAGLHDAEQLAAGVFETQVGDHFFAVGLTAFDWLHAQFLLMFAQLFDGWRDCDFEAAVLSECEHAWQGHKTGPA